MHNNLLTFIYVIILQMGPYFMKPNNEEIKKSLYQIKEKTNIMLVGDSVLDNFYWLTNKKRDLKQQLEDMRVSKDSNIYNFAVDESETKDILPGKVPSHQYQYERNNEGMEGYPVDIQDGKVYPIKLVEEIVEKYPNSDNVVILSVGGNDGRVTLPLLMDKTKTFQNVVDKMINAGFKDNFIKIVETFTKLKIKLVVVMVYKPYGLLIPGRGNDVNSLYDFFRDFYNETCKKYKLPLIDLSVTFNYKDPTHYGEGNGISPIEPSNKSSQFIADLISNVITDFNFRKDEAKVYSGYEKIEINKI